jgi:hypothetical protein
MTSTMPFIATGAGPSVAAGPKAPVLAAARQATELCGATDLADWVSNLARDVVSSCVAVEDYARRRLGPATPGVDWVRGSEPVLSTIATSCRVNRRCGSRWRSEPVGRRGLLEDEPIPGEEVYSLTALLFAGKCGYKLLQYAATGHLLRPTRSAQTRRLFPPSAPRRPSPDDWLDAVLAILELSTANVPSWVAARARVMQQYSYDLDDPLAGGRTQQELRPSSETAMASDR